MDEQPEFIDLAGLPEVFVDTTYRSLRHLLGEWPEIFDELAAACEDHYALSVEAAQLLGRFGLLDRVGKVRPTVVPVVLSAANGDGPAHPSYSGIAEYRVWTRPGPAPVPMTDQQKTDLIAQCLKIAGIFDSVFSEYESGSDEHLTDGSRALCDRNSLSSRRDEHRADGLNAFYDRTTSGLYLEFYYGGPDKLWTPWGSWSFAYCDDSRTSSQTENAVSRFMTHLDAELLIPLQQNRFGAFGPIYKLHGIDSEKLPAPGDIRPPANAEEYETGNAEWARFFGLQHVSQTTAGSMNS